MKKLLLTVTTLTALGFAQIGIADQHRGEGPRAKLKKMDADGDGQISLQEFHSPEKRMFRHADTNGDGSITIDEINAHIDERVAERSNQMRERMADHFTEIDTNGDGMVTNDEARATAFTRLDENGDGYLSKAELKKAAKHRRMKRDHMDHEG